MHLFEGTIALSHDGVSPEVIPFHTTFPLKIFNEDNLQRAFYGSMYELAFYNRILNQTEVNAFLPVRNLL